MWGLFCSKPVFRSRMKTIGVVWMVWWVSACGAATLQLTEQDFPEIHFMNLTADPCTDFYQFTCGNFENLHPLRDGQALIDQFSLLEDALAETVQGLLSVPIRGDDVAVVKKAKLAFQACTDRTFIETIGLRSPEVEVVNKYGGFPILGGRYGAANLESSWNEIADIAAEFGISIFFTPSLYADALNASRNLLRISSDGMGIPVQFRPMASESYEDAIEEGFQDMVKESATTQRLQSTQSTISAMEVLLRKLVLKLKRAMGSDRSDEYLYERVANISNFLKGIYSAGYIPEGTEIDPIVNDTSATVVTLQQLNQWTALHFGNTVQLDWVEYTRRLLQYTQVDIDDDFLILRPAEMETMLYGILNWVRMNDWEIVKSAALLRAFTYTAADSDAETRKDFEEYLVQTGKTVYPRWQYCARKMMDTTGTLSFALAVTYEYQARAFNTTSRRTAAALVANLRSTFKEVIEAATWMDDESKAAAQTKADNIAVLLGYPDFATDAAALELFYENLPIASWDHYANAKKLRAFQLAYTLNMVSYRNRTAWDKSPLDVNAYYNRQNNRIVLPVAMLNPVFFQGTSSLLDYSRIGTVIGHEITHGFDGQGFLYNAQGVIDRWWSDETLDNFSANTQCFIDQYSQYPIPELNATLSGSGSLNENLADNGGLRTALQAFQKLSALDVDRYQLPTGQALDAAQLFFVGYGTMWCNSESVSYLKSVVASCESSAGCHARASMRVNGVVANMEEFAKAFQCPVGAPMNPATKCRLW